MKYKKQNVKSKEKRQRTNTEKVQEARTNKVPMSMIAILFVGAFISILNETLLNIALPSIMTEFNVSSTTVEWLSTGYMLINGILIPTSAFFVQKLAERKLFTRAIVIFILGSFISSIAPSFGILLLGRMIQACGSAFMMPMLMNVMLTAFPIEKRGTVMGIFGLVMVVAPAVGPTISGLLIGIGSWRLIFISVLIAMILVGIVAFMKFRDISQARPVTLDIVSLILSSFGFGLLLFGFSSAGEDGWKDFRVYGSIMMGLLLLVIFVYRQAKLKEPMLDIKIYKYKAFALSSVMTVILNMTSFSILVILPMYVQTVRGFSALESGLLMLPGSLVMGLMSPVTGRLFDKYGGKVLAIIGLLITMLAMFGFSRFSMETAFATMIILNVIRMFGLSMVNMPIMTYGLNQLPKEKNPHGTAINSTTQQVAGSIGTALMVTIMNNKMSAFIDKTGALNQTQEAMLYGIKSSFLVSMGLIAIIFVLAFFIKKKENNKLAS